MISLVSWCPMVSRWNTNRLVSCCAVPNIYIYSGQQDTKESMTSSSFAGRKRKKARAGHQEKGFDIHSYTCHHGGYR